MADAPGYRVLLRFVLAVAIGSVVFFGVLRIDFWILKTIWADYAAAAPDRAYTLPMLLVRLVVFGLAIALASIAATRVSAIPRMPWIAGIVIFLVSIPDHFYPGWVWIYYPAWYHYAYLASIVPIAVIAGADRKFKAPFWVR